jgi:hypothetical protein
VTSGAAPLLNPPAKNPRQRWRWAENYRRNGDHRLLCLGLYRRGDLLRRRRVYFGSTPELSLKRDLATGETCYRFAANLLQRNPAGRSGLVGVLEKLAQHFRSYVDVLQVLALDRLRLRTRLSEKALADLIQTPDPVPIPQQATGDSQQMDQLLDLLSDYRRNRTAAKKLRLTEMARRQGISLSRLLDDE